MKKRLLIIFIFCSITLVSQTTVIDSIFSGGIFRSYRLYVPAIYNGSAARPLIINMHGYTSNASDQQFYSNFMPIADTANFLIVYPNGTYSGTSRYWNAGLGTTGADDLGFLSRLIDSLKAQYNIDLNRVYSTGMSMGGFMSHTLACELSNRIAAIASVTGSIFLTQFGSNCNPTRPVPVMQIHGTADATVPYNGNSTMASVLNVVNYWVNANNCNTAAFVTPVPNTNLLDGCTADNFLYSGGNLGSTVEHYRINGGAHTWPGSPFVIGVTNQDFDASKEIWRFFRKYKLNLLTSVDEENKQNANVSLYPNPTNGIFNIDLDFVKINETTIEITNALGQVVYASQIQNKKSSINISYLTAGFYYITINYNGKQKAIKKFVKD